MDTTIFRPLRRAGGGGKYETEMHCPNCSVFSSATVKDLGAYHFALQCLKCRKSVLVITNTPFGDSNSIEPGNIVDYYPKRMVTVDPFVPIEIAKDYLEAQRCFSVGAWQACCVMVRRCMHHIVAHFKAEGADLPKQIQDLKTKDLASSLLVKTADKIRVLGKHGAHPFNFGGESLEELTIEDANAALEFCDFVFNELFIHPGKLNTINPGTKAP